MKIIRLIVPLLAATGLLTPMSSCNSKAEEDNTYFSTSSNVAITGFSLKKDDNILSNLDSVFFSIDLERGIIYNADSLPKGTDIKRLIPVITYPTGVVSATITMTGGTYRTGDVNYLTNPSDSIDFTGNVSLRLTAQDGTTSRLYELKVNVHKTEPDSLWWDEMAKAPLPAIGTSPRNQKTVMYSGKVVSLIEESDGQYTVSSTTTPNTGEWTKKTVTFEFTPNVRSFTSTDDSLYILSETGGLYTSTDASTWTDTGLNWENITGGYGSYVLGLRQTTSGIIHTCYPASDAHPETLAEESFPIKDHSNFTTFNNKWMTHPIGILTGGIDINDEYTPSTWGYDGIQWVNLSETPAPALRGATIIPYYSFLKSSTQWVTNEYSVLLLLGGQLEDGEMNSDVYLSYDSGITWHKASQNVQMPDYIPAMMMSDNAVIDTPMSSNFAPETWSSAPSRDMPSWYRIKYETDGYGITWNCPYIYLFGGQNANGQLYDTIWKGVINRLTFAPLI